MDACSEVYRSCLVVVTFSWIVVDEFWKASVHMDLPAMRPCNLTILTLILLGEHEINHLSLFPVFIAWLLELSLSVWFGTCTTLTVRIYAGGLYT